MKNLKRVSRDEKLESDNTLEVVVCRWWACGVSLVGLRWVAGGLVVGRWWLAGGSLVGPGAPVCGVRRGSLWRLAAEFVGTVDGSWELLNKKLELSYRPLNKL